jgi:predicted HNH restriction endonuclease
LIEVLEVHHIKPLAQGGADERHNMIVVTPTLHALIHSDPACEIDLKSGKIRLFGRDFIIQVAATHNG